MEEKIKDAFSSLTMPEECDKKIRAAMARPARLPWRHTAAAACLVLALVVLLQPPVVQAVERAADSIRKVLFGGKHPMVWLMVQGDELYYTGNGEKINITDRISAESPFTYEYIDEDGIRHYIAIGGDFDPEDETHWGTLGWSEWTQAPPYDYSSWVGGDGAYPWKEENLWLEEAKDLMGIPWP